MLNSLVHADWPVKYDTFPGIGRRSAQRILSDCDRLDGNQHPLRVETVQEILESLAFLSDAILLRYKQVIDEDRVRVDRLASHLGDALDLDFAAVEVGVEDGDTIGRSL